ncbi:NADPH2:quinone reductase [Rhizobium tibeticum]|uniref:quinone oxidoreductase family protein n=1 Tax=Rhizobium tibeticum TaxID=501024 RepID=UPI00277E36C7|nr:zinc-binding dehydrogenase [Rhizobium tibeticum]MDP9810183.1 NADPH2:quinone reductase [Rhizobium tibeticum]
MKAILLESFGGPDRLQLKEIANPQPGAGQVSIDVAFAGVGFVDTLIRAGRFDFVPLPITPGIEVSGRIRALGPGVTGFTVGQPVAALLTDFTRAGLGGYAEIALAQAALTVPLPPGMDLAIAAATVVNGATAIMATEAMPQGVTVAISGASGGLGRSLIIAARAAGAARIVAISSKSDLEKELQLLGASEVVSPVQFAVAEVNLDFAFDTVGGELRLSMLRALKAGGQLMVLGNASGSDSRISADEIWLRNISVAGLSTGGLSHLAPERIAAAAWRALDIVRSDIAKPTILPLARAEEAHHRLESGLGGKIVLAV